MVVGSSPYMSTLDVAQLKKLKVQELKSLLEQRNLPVAGKKEELISRLLKAEETKPEEEPEINDSQPPPPVEETADDSQPVQKDSYEGKSESEKKRLRALRFGLPLSNSPQKKVREERFNIEPASKDTQKKRAEKFSPAKRVIDSEEEERRRKRLERFSQQPVKT